MTKFFIFSLTAIFMLSQISLTLAEPWETAKSTHFIIYYRKAPERFIDELIEQAEEYYDKIADDLGFRRYHFWLDANRAKIYIYDDAQQYQSETGQAAWSSGFAYIEQKIIHTYPYAKEFFKTTLPHEMGHIIFREFVGFHNKGIPHWLDEGVASYQMDLRLSGAGTVVKEAIRKEQFMPLVELSSLDPQSMIDQEKISLFYAESVNVVEYLVKKFGQDSFMMFCRELRDKADFQKALSYAYPFKNIGELDEEWLRYLK